MRPGNLVRSLLIIALTLITVQGANAKSFYSVKPEARAPGTASIVRVPTDAATLEDAIRQVPNGGAIEMAAGTYSAPSGGWKINNPQKGFTIRAAEGAQVVLSGGGRNPILVVQNSSLQAGGPLILQGLTFDNGHSNIKGLGAGVTFYKAYATILDSTFTNNRKTVTTVGGAVGVADDSTVFIINSQFKNNSSIGGGGAVGARDARVYIHGSEFIANTAPSDGGNPTTGGGVNMGNGVLRVSNSRFEDNTAEGHGAAVYGIGNWNNTPANPTADVLIVNSFFKNNSVTRPANSTWVAEGGAVTVEDQTRLRIYSSVFETNSALIGGGITIFRSQAEIAGSTFLGNQATDTSPNSGFAGAINFNFNDRPDYARLTVSDSYFQGKFGSVSTVAQYGGGIYAHGNRTINRPKIVIQRSLFNDLDVKGNDKSGAAGAIGLTAGDMTLENSMFVNNDAFGPAGGIGGAIYVVYDSIATIRSSTFAGNSAVTNGGALFLQGSRVDLSDNTFIENEVSPGVTEEYYRSYGAAIFSGSDSGNNMNATGTISNNLFSKNIGIPLFDDDRTKGPINDIQYNNNRFFTNTYGSTVYLSSLAPQQDASQLNALVVSRENGTRTDKSPEGNNTQLKSAPDFAALLSTPSGLLPNDIPGLSETSRGVYLGYVLSGSSPALDGASVRGPGGVKSTSTRGAHILTAGSATDAVEVGALIRPSAAITQTPANGTVSLSWELKSGTFLESVVDLGQSVSSDASGSAQLPQVGEMEYHLLVLTQEGGILSGDDSSPPELRVPQTLARLTGLNLPRVRTGSLVVDNAGGGSFGWTASVSGEKGLIKLNTTSGEADDFDLLHYTIDLGSRAPGVYTGYIDIDAGEAGTQRITITVTVLAELQQNFLPTSPR